MMIYIDTERLQSVMLTLENANQAIDEANQLLMQITTHNDWGCKERHAINDYVLNCRKEIQVLQQNSESFYRTSKSVADEFLETETGISRLFESVEGVLAKAISANVPQMVTKVPGTLQSVGHIAKEIFENRTEGFPASDISGIWEKVEGAFGEGKGVGGFRGTSKDVDDPKKILEQAINIVNFEDLVI